ncbi:SUF system NifU family Fe-S cluster assembly protein [Crenobacter sp. SG2305]|uniref:Fe-S cluster assembly sulfur transfer protein SufU n=1 Tax=Crenobacter oryzisoli TaxID=3056844 RepID=UPI0025AA7086|nr:SUF system NifU family Fe-S cluster assembly protein [Crenobacter sp. SG2305]MDN0083380.1 SUF system NifU family Fe-S cluster assembly protein [Crenobacter sp. SG2305]
MSDLRELYQELIVDHYRHPHNFGPLDGANRRAEGVNPLCGDRLTLWLRVVDGVIEDARFEGVGCAISTASASLMTDALKGRTEEQAEALFTGFRALVTGGADAVPAVALGKLEVLAGVREFPTRVKCATLAWHTLQAALHDDGRPVSTE